MILRDLTDVGGWIKRIIYRLDRIEAGAPLENASVTNGLFRFIGGVLKLDTGARLDGEGTMKWTGPVTLDGDVEITKTLQVAALTRLLAELIVDGGKITSGNIRIEDGRIHVGDGIVIDSATGEIRVNNMTISERQGGSIEAPFQIVLKSSIVEVQSGIHVEQGAVFDGQITAASLQPISIGSAPAGAFPGAIMRDASKRLRVVVADS